MGIFKLKTRKLLTCSLLLAITFLSFSLPRALATTSSKPTKLLRIAHRGASGYAPENTLAAFDKAVEMKCDYIELDIHLSKDRKIVVIHDNTVDRTTDSSGKVCDLTLAELQQLDAGSWFDKRFKGETIPTLDEVLERYRGKIGILIEVKDPSSSPGIEDELAKLLQSKNMDKPNNDKIIVQSFDHKSIRYFKSIMPNIPVGVLLSYRITEIPDKELDEFNQYADYVNPNYRIVNNILVKRIHNRNMKINPWTVNNPKTVIKLIRDKVDGIISNYPDIVPKLYKPLAKQ